MDTAFRTLIHSAKLTVFFSFYRMDAAGKRLQKEIKQLKKKPLDLIWAEPDPGNIKEWHYCFEGPKDTPYEGGFYHGLLKFPAEYPFKPPAIYMYTPNGRYVQNTRIW